MTSSWDQHALTYDEIAGHGRRLSPAEHAAWTGLLRRLIDPGKPRRVLDVGTGTGFLALLLAELGHEVIGIDPSEAMLAKARAKADAAGFAIDFRAGDAAETGLPDASVDAVVSRHVLWLLPEPERAVSAWARATRSGGQIIDIDAISAPVTLLDRSAVLLSQALEFARTRRWSPHAHTEFDSPLRGITDPTPAVNVFLRAGLRDVRTEWLTGIDRIERAAMNLEERLTLRWHRYLIEAAVA